MPLFIKRGHKVYGPFSVAQIKSGVENKEIAAADYISKSKDGPWHNFAELLANPESLIEPGEQTASQSPRPAATPSKTNTVACEDCGGIVSLRATNCPHCGCPQVNLPQYFIKRNETVTGPFNINQINAGTQSQTLKASDLLGISENGPWAPLSDYHQKTSGNASIVTSMPVTAVPLDTPSPLVSDPPLVTPLPPIDAPPLVTPLPAVTAPPMVNPLPPVTVPPLGSSSPSQTSSTETGILQFTRNTGKKGLLVKMKIFVDGKMKATLAVRQTVRIPLSVGLHRVEVKGGGSFRGDKKNVRVTANNTTPYSVRYTLTGGLKIDSVGPAFPSSESVENKTGGDGATLEALIEGAGLLFDLLTDD